MSAVATRGNYAPQRPTATQVSARPTLTRAPAMDDAKAVHRRRVVVSVVIVAAFIMIYLVRQLVSVSVSDGAYEIAALNQTQVNLQRDAEFASEKLRVMDSPQNLANMAEKLGMISNAQPAYLRLSDSHVFGSPTGAEKTGSGAVPIANDLVKQLGVSSVAVAVSPATSADMSTVVESDAGAVASSTEIPAPKTN